MLIPRDPSANGSRTLETLHSVHNLVIHITGLVTRRHFLPLKIRDLRLREVK